jgi:hypothetical protein
MIQDQQKPTRLHAIYQIFVATFLIMLSLALVACGTTITQGDTPLPQDITLVEPTITMQITAQITETYQPIATMERTYIPGTQVPTRVGRTRTPVYGPTRGLGDPDLKTAADTRVAQNQATRWAALPLTPSSTPGSPTATYTPKPTVTIIMGFLGCASMTNSYVPQYATCWQLSWEGRLYQVKAGRYGTGSNMNQGILTIGEAGPDNMWHEIGTYETPSKQGPIDIASVDGTRIYLIQSQAPRPPGVDVTPVVNFVFVFDLATLQWVNP